MKKGIKIPIIRGKRGHYPTKPLCPWCKKRKVMEPHSMAILTGGALAKLGKDYYAGPTKNLKGYLGFHWHGGHDGGKGKYRENDVLYHIADEVEGGLFDIMFCSVKCLREFLNSCLDEFERKVKKLKPLA
jgi:hypothetical protein